MPGAGQAEARRDGPPGTASVCVSSGFPYELPEAEANPPLEEGELAEGLGFPSGQATSQH